MSALVMAVGPHFKKVVIKQQTAGVASAQLTQLAVSDITSAFGATPNTVPRPDNILIQALPANTGTITIMPVNPATSLGAGYILSAGQSISLPTQLASEWYVIGSAASQLMNIHYQFGVL
jgi:hypothetical protein